VSLLRLVRDPGRRWPPESSVPLRVSAAAAVLVGIAACEAEGELSAWYALCAAALLVAGNVVSYRRRASPVPYLKSVLGAAMVAAFCWFLLTVSADASAGYLPSVEAPLAVLFTAMQAAHSFDMPSRRDLGFAIAGSATLVAVAATQAVDLAFGLFVALWAACCVSGMSAAWSSMAGGARVRAGALVASVAAAVAVAVLLVAALPAPQPPAAPSSASGRSFAAGGQHTEPSRLVPAASGRGLARSAPSGGPTGVGGFLGFAGPLDTALRASLGNEVVLRVRADRPTFWLAETFDTWSGRSWRAGRGSTPRAGAPGGLGRTWDVVGGPPFLVAPAAAGIGPAGTAQGALGDVTPPPGAPAAPDYQTFYLVGGASDLVLHADQASVLWVPTHRVYVASDGTIRSGTVFGSGSDYSVLSTVATPTPGALERSNGRAGLTAAAVAADLELPHRYPRVAALARRVTADAPTVDGKVTALEEWIGGHTRYTTDIPPLGPGQDTVDQFLFGTRRGYCEQISTALAVMLRTLGIPAREAVGYVPGPYDPVSGLYEEQARDAHAWVQVWFPGYGWQSFDPTAQVPLATPSPGATLAHDLLHALGVVRRVPVLPTAPLAAVLALVGLALLARRRRPRTWRAAVTRSLEGAARRAGLHEDPGETLESLATRLDAANGDARVPLGGGRAPGGGPGSNARAATRGAASALAAAAERSAWSGTEPDGPVVRAYVRDARRVRRAAGRRRLVRVSPRRGARGPRRSSRPRPTGAGTPSAGAAATPRGPR
jgi:hypothetical protein